MFCRKEVAIWLTTRLYNTLSGDYRKYRPQYPLALFDYLAGLCGADAVAWDCATGNGQAAVGLAKHFRFVWATDAARRQIDRAAPHPRVRYSQADCASSGLPPNSVDIVSVALGLHWFNDLGLFYREVDRVLRPGGVFAAVSYFLPRVDDKIDALFGDLYRAENIRRFWYPGFRHVEEKYHNLPMPFSTMPQVQQFEMGEERLFAEFQGYLCTWPHVVAGLHGGEAKFIRQALGKIKVAWGGDRLRRKVSWQVNVQVVIKHAEPDAAADPGRKAGRGC